jgi:Nitrous oxidase accessory protein
MKAYIAMVTVYLVFSLSIIISPVSVQEPLNLTIKPDGSVVPSTDLLERNGNTYTFKGDINGTIWVQTNNIMIDGAGYTLCGNGVNTGQNSEIGILLGGTDLSRRECRGVLITNLRINIPRGIYSVGGSNNSFIGNYFENSVIEIQGNANLTGDLVSHNSFIGSFVSFDYNPNGTDVIVENNFVDGGVYVWLAKAPVVDRNYWSNYTVKYPNASVLDGSGVWDTPYVYGTADTYPVVDYHPLVNSMTDFEVSGFGILPSMSVTSTPTPTVNTGAQPPKMEPFNAALIAAAIVMLVVLCLGLVVYIKKRKPINHTSG